MRHWKSSDTVWFCFLVIMLAFLTSPIFTDPPAPGGNVSIPSVAPDVDLLAESIRVPVTATKAVKLAAVDARIAQFDAQIKSLNEQKNKAVTLRAKIASE